MSNIVSVSTARLCKVSLTLSLLMLIIFAAQENTKAQSVDTNFELRFGINMTTITGNDNGLRLGIHAGAGAKVSFSQNSSVIGELQYDMAGASRSNMIDTTSVKVKIYDKTRLHYLNIPIVYQYYFKDILGLEIGPQFGFCLGGNDKDKVGNSDWTSFKIDSKDYNVFDVGMVVGVYTNNITTLKSFFISLRAYFGFTDVMREIGNNKNIFIKFGVGYIFGND